MSKFSFLCLPGKLSLATFEVLKQPNLLDSNYAHVSICYKRDHLNSHRGLVGFFVRTKFNKIICTHVIKDCKNFI